MPALGHAQHQAAPPADSPPQAAQDERGGDESKSEVHPPAKRGALGWTSSTYFAEGLPWSLLHQVAAEYFTAIGLRPAEVGYTSLLHATTSFKFVWSPIVDLFGSLRQWMVFTQAAMGVATGLLAVVAHQVARTADVRAADPTWVWAILVLIGVLSATHDIACDGYYMEALDRRKQAEYSGSRVAAFRAAMLFGSSGLVFIGGSYNWLLGFGIGAGMLVVLAVLHQRWLPRQAKPRALSAAATGSPPAERSASAVEPSASASEPSGGGSATPKSGEERFRQIAMSYISFLRQDRVLWVIAFLLTYKMADVLMFSMSKVLLSRELGVPTDVRGLLNSVSVIASIGGAIVGGAWIARASLRRALFPITLLMAVTEPLFVILAAYAPDLAVAIPGTAESFQDLDFSAVASQLSVIGGIIVTEQFCGGMATAAQMVFIMRRCNPAHRAAHFAFATAVYSTAQMAVGAYSGIVYEQVGPVDYFWIASAVTLPAVVISRLVPTD